MTTPQDSQEQGVGSPISNAAYNVFSALHSKLEELEAYRKYAQDDTDQLWQQLSQAESIPARRQVVRRMRTKRSVRTRVAGLDHRREQDDLADVRGGRAGDG
jgi:hypothetical protein